MEKFAPAVQPGGVIFINKSLINIGSGRNDIDELSVSVAEIATELGNGKAANIVALSAFVARSKTVSLEALKKSVEAEFQKKPKLIPLNMEAVAAGIKAAQ